jgi:membrane-associated phospholipid phosphatase
VPKGFQYFRSHRRAFYLILVVFFSVLYFPINRFVGDGTTMATPLDAWIPVWPGFIFPYLLAIVWWAFCITWAVFRMEARRWQVFATALIICFIISDIIYIIFPTYVIRPVVQGNNLASAWLNQVYAADKPYNAFPSSHTFTSVLIFLAWREWKPRLAWLWGLVCLTILISILFVHQHYVADLVGGIVLAVGVFLLVRRGSDHA